MTERLDQLRAKVPDIFARASAALSNQSGASYALAAHELSARAVSNAVRELLPVIYKDTTVPMIERAGWSMAFHSRHRDPFVGINDFATKASECQGKLEAIDGLLREPGAPILAINPGPPGDYQHDSLAMRYAVARSDGSGLDIRQVCHDEESLYHHRVSAPEEEYAQGRSTYRGFTNDSGFSDPLISNLTPNTLVTSCVDPERAVSIVESERDSEFGHVYVIGKAAIAAFFDEGPFNTKMDMLRGAVAFAGVTL